MIKKKRLSKIVAFVFILVIINTLQANIFSYGAENEQAKYQNNGTEPVNDIGESGSAPRYEQYISKYEHMPHPDAVQLIKATSFIGTDGMHAEILYSFKDSDRPVLKAGETGSVYWDMDVQEDGLYNIAIRYYPIEGNGSLIEREIQIDGKAPFDEARHLSFTRVWGNEFDKVEYDEKGNAMRPEQVERPCWREVVLQNSEDYSSDAYSFYLAKGRHRITMVSYREPMVIDYIKIFQQGEMPEYKTVAQNYRQKGYENTSQCMIKIQGESAAYKSNSSLYPINDRTSPATEPYHVWKIVLNTIGGNNWRLPGQWITWDFEVPRNGLYELGIKYKQNQVRGIGVARKLYIDGKVPFKEAEAISFPFDGSWQTVLLGGKENPYMFYLTKGIHQLTLEVTTGELSDIIRVVRQSSNNINALYRKIVMITGTSPDIYRDYLLEKRIKNLEKILAAESETLNRAADKVDNMSRGSSDKAAILRTSAYSMSEMAKNPDTIPARVGTIKDITLTLGTWLSDVNYLPLEIDYLYFKSPDVKIPSPNAGFFENLKHEFLSFLYTFTGEYRNIGKIGRKNGTLTVWVNSGRDQAQILKSMVSSTFTPKTGIKVNLQLVNGNALLPATLAGKGPDVALSIGNVIDYAMRNALQDLKEFPDYETVKKRFMRSAFEGFKFQNGIYAIPEKQSFPMMFYRKDVLDEIGIKVPDTWKDLYFDIPELYKRNMQIGMTPNTVFEMLLYQNGGKYYQGDGIATDIGSPAGVEAFEKWSELYYSYKLPREFDFVNRFRTGEMPIGIADYSTYNSLVIFAPEISGQWGFAPVPGTLGTDGEVHREVVAKSDGTVMFKNTNDKKAAWEFIKWWTDSEAQSDFGREIEVVLGESGRYTTANVEALRQLPWKSEDYKRLKEQWKWVNGMPDVPGGYSLTRHLTNAFYEVYNDGKDTRETLDKYVNIINEEIKVKRQEFDLPTK